MVQILTAAVMCKKLAHRVREVYIMQATTLI